MIYPAKSKRIDGLLSNIKSTYGPLMDRRVLKALYIKEYHFSKR